MEIFMKKKMYCITISELLKKIMNWHGQVRFGLKPFTLQDLQDSAVCQMLDNGVPEATMYKLLNEDEPTVFGQKGGKVTDSDMRKALEKLEKQLPKSY